MGSGRYRLRVGRYRIYDDVDGAMTVTVVRSGRAN
jgi:mRNA-degrading endonuclease RelE of RelBE toxin-antitoxin system